MRVSNRMLYSQLVDSMNSNTEKLLDLNNKASSGKRITRPGDDPVAMANVLIYRSELSSFDQYQKSISRAKGFMDRTESVLASVNEQLDAAISQATQMGTATQNAATRLGAAEAVRQIRETITGLANAKYGDKYIFGGTSTQTPPFQNFDVTKLQADVNQISATPPGAPATGARYIDTDDNHIYQYDGTAWQDQGAPATGMAAKNAADGKLYVYNSTTGWTTHYQGNSDSFNIKISKTDEVTANLPGDSVFQNSMGDVFQSLIDLEKSLRANDQTGIQATLSQLNSASKVVNNNITLLGARENRLEYLANVTKRSTTDTKASLSDLEDLDYAKALTDLQNQQIIYQASLKSAAMITKMSLADYI